MGSLAPDADVYGEYLAHCAGGCADGELVRGQVQAQALECDDDDALSKKQEIPSDVYV